jgi:hypothetical protein
MKVKSTEELYFSDFEWGIGKDEVAELPESRDAQKAILAHPSISEVKDKPASKTTTN